MTTYHEVEPGDVDVALFIARNLDQHMNIYHLPSKMWVARQDDRIVAVLTLKTEPFVSIDLVLDNPAERAFMRIIKLWYMAEDWLIANSVPIVCFSINNAFAHFQSIVKRLGFEKVATQPDGLGLGETVFAKRLLPDVVAESETIH